MPKKEEKITKCPHCGSEKGMFTRWFLLYEKQRYYDYDRNFIEQKDLSPEFHGDRGYWCTNCGALIQEFAKRKGGE